LNQQLHSILSKKVSTTYFTFSATGDEPEEVEILFPNISSYLNGVFHKPINYETPIPIKLSSKKNEDKTDSYTQKRPKSS